MPLTDNFVPTEGRIVHYVHRQVADHCVAAIIVRAWDKGVLGTSNLHLFFDGSNDGRLLIDSPSFLGDEAWATSATHNSLDLAPHTYHTPQECPR